MKRGKRFLRFGFFGILFFLTALFILFGRGREKRGKTMQLLEESDTPMGFISENLSSAMFPSPLDEDRFRLDGIPQEEFPEQNTSGTPHPVQPEDVSLPNIGTNTLRTILGPLAEIHVFNSVCGLYVGDCENIPYEKSDAITRLVFPDDWIVDIDNVTGNILIPSGLPGITAEEIAELTWREMKNGGHVRQLAETLVSQPLHDGTPARLVGFQLDEIRYVADKVFAAWRLVQVPPSSDGSFLRFSFGIDRKTKKATFLGIEVHEY